MPRHVLVLGASGRFGQAAVQAFAAAGWQVSGQVRHAPVAPWPAGATPLVAPLSDTDTLAAGGAEVVVHAVNPLYTAWDTEAMPALRHGLDVAERLRAHFMLPGNVYNFGAGMPARLDERTTERPTTEKGRQRVMMEAEIAARAARGSLRGTVIRAGDFYGGGRGSWLDLVVVKDLAKGRLVYPGPLNVAHAWAYLPDLARTFVAAASLAQGPAFARLHFAGHTLTGRELLAALERVAGALGLAPAGGWRRGSMPWGLMRLASPFWPMGRELLAMRYLWQVPHALDGSALAQAVGVLPQTPVDEALAQALTALGFGAPGASEFQTTLSSGA